MKEQLFRPLSERFPQPPQLETSSSLKQTKDDNTDDDIIHEEQYQDNPPSQIISSEQAVKKLVQGLTDPSWKEALHDAIHHSDSFRTLATFLAQERASGTVIYPPEKDIFAALNLCPLDQVKVVIVGQDPYHGPKQAHGLAFSVPKGQKPPPSLKNIVKEVMDDVGIEEPPTHGCLERWASQEGVLLLNTVLTVQRGKANSHANQGWEAFTDAVIQAINQKEESIVFLLWGRHAATKAKDTMVDTHKHTVIRTSHPSPLGATKTDSPFLGSRCFSRANKALENSGKGRIDWNIV